jgi:hypothetical protein
VTFLQPSCVRNCRCVLSPLRLTSLDPAGGSLPGGFR